MPGEAVVSPKLDFMRSRPSQILEELSRTVTKEEIGLLVGQSLGGFYALALGVWHDLPCVLTNPCLFPAETAVVTESELSREILEEYRSLSSAPAFGKAFILLSRNDTVIPGNLEICRRVTDKIKMFDGTHSRIEGLDEELKILIPAIRRAKGVFDLSDLDAPEFSDLYEWSKEHPDQLNEAFRYGKG
ncbi:MAG: hypothetical protein IJ071_02275 [Ruminococcus sp.]|nr:hypothetical protein [Ruminococcus sp.]